MPDERHAGGLIDTSVVIDLELIEPADLPRSSPCLRSRWPNSPRDRTRRPIRPNALADRTGCKRAEATFEPLPVDGAVARAYGRVYAAVGATGRKARGRRAMDLFIAATAVAVGLPLYTRNPDDFAGLSDLLEIVSV